MSDRTSQELKKEGMTISKLGQRRQVVIPKDICEELGLEEGDFIEVKSAKGSVVIKPKKLVDADDILTPEEEQAILKGEQQLRKGEYVTLDQLKNDLARPARKRSRKTA
jgi:AbrB family looped-hinge helix DNA binding protein